MMDLIQSLPVRGYICALTLLLLRHYPHEDNNNEVHENNNDPETNNNNDPENNSSNPFTIPKWYQAIRNLPLNLDVEDYAHLCPLAKNKSNDLNQFLKRNTNISAFLDEDDKSRVLEEMLYYDC